jgi:hypothetical protein
MRFARTGTSQPSYLSRTALGVDSIDLDTQQTLRSVPPAESPIDFVRMEEPILKVSLSDGGAALVFVPGTLTFVRSHRGQ